MKEFDFTLSDLQANKAGRLSARQQEMVSAFLLGAHKRLQLAAAVGGFSPLVVVGLVYLLEPTGFEQSMPYLLPAYALYLLILGIALFRGSRLNQVLAESRVQTVSGSPALSTAKVRRWTAYYAEIGGVRFQLQSNQFQALQKHRQYRVHYLPYPPTHWILSLEEK